jgi:lysozyme
MVDRQKVIELLTRHEGYRAFTYRDTAARLTIGIGFNLDAPGAAERCAAAGVDYDAVCFAGHAVTQAQALALLDERIQSAQDVATITVAGFMDMPENVQLVIIDMIFDQGSHPFGELHELIAAFEAHDWRQAVSEMRALPWYGEGEMGTRAMEDIALVLSAVAPD